MVAANLLKRNRFSGSLQHCWLGLLRIAIAVGAMMMFHGVADAESIRLRLAWGGGERVAWNGQISLSEGAFSASSCLGTEPDAAASIFVQPAEIQIRAPRPIAYQAVDVTINAPLTATLDIKFSGSTIREGMRVLSVPISDLIDETFNEPLDAAGNRLLIRRSPGDQLQVTTARDQLVFAPGDRWDLTISPALLKSDDSPQSNRVAIRMMAARSTQVIWRTESELVEKDTGRSAAASIPIPKTEGVYDLVLSYGAARNIGLFRANNRDVQRRIQFVVVSPLPDASQDSDQPAKWREAVSFDPSQPRWWERLSRFPNWQRLSIAPRRLQGKGTAEVIDRDGQPTSRLQLDGWQAYPLPVVSVGMPHILEVDYPSDASQSLGISIVESGPDGPENLQSLDHAIHIQAPSWTYGSKSCRVVFWPRTRMPHVLLTNLDDQRDAVFGRIRLLEGPSQLPPSAARGSDRGYREALAQFDAPDFFKAFSASYGVDADSGRGLTDWVTFKQAGQRMVEYLQHAGFGGATVTCVADGGAICPVPQMDATPRFDTGPFFETGQDALEKDILEMLFRYFDREQLRLVIGVKLNSPLPALEQQLRDPQRADGLALVDAKGNVPTATTGMPRYNPLDPRVQQVAIRLIRDLVLRYSRHPSFAGISLEVGPDSILNLPGPYWGYDRQTLAAFRRDKSAEIGQTGQPFCIEQLTNGPLRSAWIDWRAERVSQTFSAIAHELNSARPDAQLVLATDKAVQSISMQSVCRPQLPRTTSVADGLYVMGLDAKRLAAAGVVLSKPEVRQPLLGLNQSAPLHEYSTDSSWPSIASGSPRRENLVQPPPFEFRSEGFDSGRVFSGQPTAASFQFQLIQDGGVELRDLSQALVENDAQRVTVGGKHVSLVDSPALKDWLATFQRLPSRAFVAPSLPETSQAKSHPVIVRQLSHAGKTYVYAVNNSPWPAQVVVGMQASSDCQFAAMDRTAKNENASATFTRGRRAPDAAAPNDRYVWRRELEPYELAACILTDPSATVDAVESQLPSTVVAELQRTIAEIGTRLATIKQARVYDKLQNAGFDFESITPLPNWESATDVNVVIERDTAVQYSGSASLKMESKQPVAWIRSTPIPVPRSGRLALQAMVRTAGSRATRPLQPLPLRLALEGVLDGAPYYRYADVKIPTNPPPANGAAATPVQEWSPFMFQVDDLPQGLTELRVRFDLMGAGVVWIDDVRLFDLAVSSDEQLQLAKLVGLANFHLREGRPADCERILRSYWPQFLLNLVPADTPRLAKLPPTTETEDTSPIPLLPVPAPGELIDRVRDLLPFGAPE